MSDEYCFPYLSQLIGDLKELDSTILLHICGDTNRYLTRMIDAGADILSLDVDVDLAEAKNVAGKHATISGNVATQRLCQANPQAIYSEACECIRNASRGGHFTLSSSCEVPIETPPSNIDAMVKAAHEYGARWLVEEEGINKRT